MTDVIVLPKRRQERGGTAADLAAVNEVLLAREWCVETDTRKVKIGDGVTAWNALPYVGELANLGNPSGDRLVYWDDAANRFDFLSLGTGLTIGSGGDLDVTGGGGGGQAAIQFKDEGTNIGSSGAITSVNFVGSGISAAVVGTTLTVTASGGGSGASAGWQIGYARTVSTTTASTTSTIPFDNTIPQNTEGAAYSAIDTTYTVQEAASLLRVVVTLNLVSFSLRGNVALALFRDSGANAIVSTIAPISAAAGDSVPAPVVLTAIVAAGSTGATTFKLRYGNGGSGTVYINSYNGTLFFGGHEAKMEIFEVKQ